MDIKSPNDYSWLLNECDYKMWKYIFRTGIFQRFPLKHNYIFCIIIIIIIIDTIDMHVDILDDKVFRKTLL